MKPLALLSLFLTGCATRQGSETLPIRQAHAEARSEIKAALFDGKEIKQLNIGMGRDSKQVGKQVLGIERSTSIVDHKTAVLERYFDRLMRIGQ